MSSLRRTMHVANAFLARDVFCISMGHASVIIAGLISVRLFTELAPRDVFGGASLLVGMVALLISGLVAPITQTQVRYQAGYTDRQLGERYVALILKYAVASSILAVAPLLFGLLFWPELRAGASGGVVPLLLGWSIATSVRSVIVGRLNAERRQREYSLYIGTEAIMILLMTVLALHLFASVEAFLAGLLVGTGTTLLLLGHLPRVVPVQRESTSGLGARARQQIWLYGMPFSIIFVFEWLTNQFDRYILAAHIEIAAVGTYAAAFTLASRPAMIVGTVVSDLLRPMLFATHATMPTQSMRYFMMWLVLQGFCSVLIVIAFHFFGPGMADLLLAEAYRPGAPELMIWISGAYGIRAFALALENRAYAMELPHRIAIAKAIPIVVGVGFALVLIPSEGIVGAAMANLAAQLSYLATCAVVLRTSGAQSSEPSHAARQASL